MGVGTTLRNILLNVWISLKIRLLKVGTIFGIILVRVGPSLRLILVEVGINPVGTGTTLKYAYVEVGTILRKIRIGADTMLTAFW